VEQYDAILIPGGGVRQGGLLPSWVQRRLDRAIEVDCNGYILALSAATPYRPPPLDENGFPIYESVAAARYLMEAGVSPERILTETQSYDTIGNAFFSRVIHVDPLRLCRLLVITSDFHLARTESVFRWVYSLEPKAVASEVYFEGVDDPGMPAHVLKNREEKERKSLESFLRIKDRIATMPECHRWVFTEHNAYNAARRGFGRSVLDADTLRSY